MVEIRHERGIATMFEGACIIYARFEEDSEFKKKDFAIREKDKIRMLGGWNLLIIVRWNGKV